jgi:hypothetical protein
MIFLTKQLELINKTTGLLPAIPLSQQQKTTS